MLMQQCRFKKGNSYTVAWVDAKKIKNAKSCVLETLDGERWEVMSKGAIKDSSEIPSYRQFKNNYTEKFGNKS